jgi:hypothetical protein
MIKLENKVKLKGNAAYLFLCTFLVGLFAKGNLFNYPSASLLTNLQKSFSRKLYDIVAMYSQSVLYTQLNYIPIRVK